jgi:ElaB/YqjD/DUF883 family membrane-anchored ribosome-binding protein
VNLLIKNYKNERQKQENNMDTRKSTQTERSKPHSGPQNQYTKKAPIQSKHENLGEHYEDIKQKTTELYEESKDTVLNFIQHKPLTSILLAAGVGFVLSLIRSSTKD